MEVVRTGKPDLRPDELVSRILKGLLTVVSESKLEIFEAVLREKPSSIYELSEKVGKNQSYVLKEVRMIKNNKTTGAVTFPEQHDRLYAQLFMESVAKGIAQGDAGLAVSTEEAKHQVEVARKARETKK